jgi:hypothetical protein
MACRLLTAIGETQNQNKQKGTVLMQGAKYNIESIKYARILAGEHRYTGERSWTRLGRGSDLMPTRMTSGMKP